MLRISNVSDWTGDRTRLATNVPGLGNAVYEQALKMGLEPQITRGNKGFRAIEFVGSESETTELLAELPSGLLEAAQVAPRRIATRPRRNPLTRAQEWARAAALVQERSALHAASYADYIAARVEAESAEGQEVELANWDGGAA